MNEPAVGSSVNGRYLLRITTLGVGCVAGLNDVPLYEDLEGKGLSSMRGINEWITGGDDALTVYVFWPPAKPYEPGEAHVEVRLWFGEIDEEPPSGPLATFRWPAPDTPEGYPFVFRKRFVVSHPPPTKLWKEAESIDRLDDSDRSAIWTLLTQFRGAIERRDVGTMYDTTAYKFEDRALADGFDPQDARDAARQLYGEMVAGDGLEVAAISQSSLVLDPVAGGRARRVTRGPGRKAIELRDQRSRKRIDVYVAKIGGVWRIVR